MEIRLLTFILLFALGESYGQDLPEIVPPSPQTFEMTKYGNVPINESTGMVNASIPLYNYKAGNIEIPVSLSYSAHGVKVNALSSWTGINWMLNAGGVITRTVKDQPDESHNPSKRLLYSREDLDALNLDPYNEDDMTFLNAVATQTATYDTQADIFSFNFLGYSGSFYLDENLNPKLTNYEQELKIEFLGSLPTSPLNTTQTIVITDPNGTRYYFGGLNGVEQSNFNNGGGSTSNTYNTAYHLYEIHNVLGDIVYFDYETKAEYSIYWGQNQKETVLRNSLYHEIAPLCASSPPPISGIINSQSAQRVFNGRFLSKIRNNRTGEELRFNTTTYNNNFHYLKRLDDIDVYFNNIKKQSFELKYLMGTNNTRFFLNKVIFNGTDSHGPSHSYSMEYNDPLGLPARDSYSQDYLGYYNGKNNQTLLPKGFEEFTYFGGNYADREPDFLYSSKGTLKKIIYPTGGSTSFEYEAPMNYRIPDEVKRMQIFINRDNVLPNTKLTDFVNLSKPSVDLDVPGIVHEIDQNQTIDVQVNVDAEGLFPIKRCDVKVTLSTILTGSPAVISSQTFHLFTTQDPLVNPNTTHTFNKSFNLIANTGYKVDLEIIPDRTDPNFVVPNDIKITANASFTIIGNTEVPYPTVGIRVRRTIDSTSQGTPVIKRYRYKAIDQLEVNERAKTLNEQAYIRYFYGRGCCVPSGPLTNMSGYSLYAFAALSANPLAIALNNDFLFYPVVTASYGDDNFKRGGIEKTFLYSSAHGQSPYSEFGSTLDEGYIYENNNLYNGKLIREIAIEQKNNTPYIKTETVFDYTVDYSDYVSNMIIIKKSPACNEWNRPITVDNTFYTYIDMGLYKTYSSKINLMKKTTREFHEDIPIIDKGLIDINTDNYTSLNTIEDYEYASYANQPTKITISTSDSDKVLETKNYYVDMVGQMTGWTQDQIAAVNTLKTMHNLRIPIQTETYQKEGSNTPELLSTQRTLYKNWNGGGLVLPQYVQTAKNNEPLENRIEFIDYTIYGDLIEVSKESGARIRYMYNPISQVIRKIENYDPAITVPHFGTNADSPPPCTYQNQHPGAKVTLFDYVDGTNLVKSIEDSKCRKTSFEYDSFYRLKNVKDADGNLVSTNEYHYKGQQ